MAGVFTSMSHFRSDLEEQVVLDVAGFLAVGRSHRDSGSFASAARGNWMSAGEKW